MQAVKSARRQDETQIVRWSSGYDKMKVKSCARQAGYDKTKVVRQSSVYDKMKFKSLAKQSHYDKTKLKSFVRQAVTANVKPTRQDETENVGKSNSYDKMILKRLQVKRLRQDETQMVYKVKPLRQGGI